MKFIYIDSIENSFSLHLGDLFQEILSFLTIALYLTVGTIFIIGEFSEIDPTAALKLIYMKSSLYL